MTPTELRITLADVEKIKIALAKARETAQSIVKRLAQIPDMSKAVKIFEDIQTSTFQCENDIMELTFSLDIAELNALLNIDTRVKDINGGAE